MTLPPLLDFPEACKKASELNQQRSCFLSLGSRQPFLGNLPEQFTITVACTKAAKKRGQYAKALGHFTRDNWFAVLLSQPTSVYGSEATEMIFTMNPLFKKHIKENIDIYRYEMFMRAIKSWDQGFNNLSQSEVLTNYLGWRLSERVGIIVRKHLYDRLHECGSFTSATAWLFKHSINIQSKEEMSPLPSCYTRVIRSHLSAAQNILCWVFGHQELPPIKALDEVLHSHIA